MLLLYFANGQTAPDFYIRQRFLPKLQVVWFTRAGRRSCRALAAVAVRTLSPTALLEPSQTPALLVDFDDDDSDDDDVDHDHDHDLADNNEVTI